MQMWFLYGAMLWILLFENDCFIKMLPTFLLSFSMFVRTWGVREICERLVKEYKLSAIQ